MSITNGTGGIGGVETEKREVHLSRALMEAEAQCAAAAVAAAEFRVTAGEREAVFIVSATRDAERIKHLKTRLVNCHCDKEAFSTAEAIDDFEFTTSPPLPSPASARDEAVNALAIAVSENRRLIQHLIDLNARVASKDSLIKRQETDILELQSLVHSLMDEVEHSNHHSSMMDSSSSDVEDLPSRSLANDLEAHLETPPHTPTLRSQDLIQNSNAGTEGSLRARLAALGLSTEGNRAHLKKRLQRYVARKKKSATTNVAAK
ncbi:hypothetical protein HK100_008341 [Physocladia obscura]|uniref:SAP domain-containing protein n=1 Tax=Physocladia obscura TaxID=109957 RepID=A0AAD5X6G0_9FUNG|nr:hypothetical protein HK100_008341 [Physocladia obscura]